MNFLVKEGKKERKKEDHVTKVASFLSFGFFALRFCLYVYTSMPALSCLYKFCGFVVLAVQCTHKGLKVEMFKKILKSS